MMWAIRGMKSVTAKIFRPVRPGLPPFHPAAILSTWFGSGLFRFAPGTMGSLAALPFAWEINRHLGSVGLMAATGIVFLIGWAASSHYVQRTQADDPGEVVIDEVAGQWLVLTAIPNDWLLYPIGFGLFRLFDILKPFPVSWADRRVSGGLGIMLDDILAGLYGGLILTFASLIRSLP